MAILTRDEMLQKLKGYIGERTDDESISLLEDISDSLSNDEHTFTQDDIDKAKDETEKIWREKYIKRFYDGNANNTIPKDDVSSDPLNEVDNSPSTFDDLFIEKEQK